MPIQNKECEKTTFYLVQNSGGFIKSLSLEGTPGKKDWEYQIKTAEEVLVSNQVFCYRNCEREAVEKTTELIVEKISELKTEFNRIKDLIDSSEDWPPSLLISS